MKTAERGFPSTVLILVAVTIAIGAIVAAASFVARSGQAVHDTTACDDVPAGFECVELTNKGGSQETLGELFFQLNGSTLTMLTNLFSEDDFGHTEQKLCVDDDSDPLGSEESCLGNSAGTKITGCGDLPDAGADEEAGGLYEVFIEGAPLTETTQFVDAVELVKYDVCVDDYTHFSFHFNQDRFSIEAFFQPTSPTPTPTATATPPDEATPTPAAAVLGETQEPAALPVSGGAPEEAIVSSLYLLLGLAGLALLIGGGTLVAVAVRRRR
ncbi:MAG: hypothetical protein ACE1ZT_02870 [Dehalococcoidia bacterium]